LIEKEYRVDESQSHRLGQLIFLFSKYI